MTTFIYALIDPRDLNVRYVGKADNPKQRYSHHCHPKARPIRANKRAHHLTRCGAWVRGLINQGLLPQMVTLEECSMDNWRERERYWIAHHRNDKLTNLTLGGEGLVGYRHTEETRAKLRAARAHRKALGIRSSMLGRHHTEEAKAKIRSSPIKSSACFRPGHKRSQESIEKQRATITGRANPKLSAWFTQERRAAFGDRIKRRFCERGHPRGMAGKVHSDATRAKMRLAVFKRVIRKLAAEGQLLAA